MVYFLLFIT